MKVAVLDGDWPITQPYGPTSVVQEPPGHGYPHFHEGIDLGCPPGTVMRAARAGQVVSVGPGVIVLLDLDGIEHYYFHGRTAYVWQGQWVTQSQAIGETGNVAPQGGASTGPHLHYGVRRSPYRYQVDDFDPAPYLSLESDMWTDDEKIAVMKQIGEIHDSFGLGAGNTLGGAFAVELAAIRAATTDPALKQSIDNLTAELQRIFK